MHGSLEGWLVAPQSGGEGEREEVERMIHWGGWVCCDAVQPNWKPSRSALPADGSGGGTWPHPLLLLPGRELKGEVESVVNIWLQAAIPRPASPPPHHLSVRIIEQRIMCSHCAMLSCSSQCYHQQQGQRFHCNVWRTRVRIHRSDTNRDRFILNETQRGFRGIFTQVWYWGQIFVRCRLNPDVNFNPQLKHGNLLIYSFPLKFPLKWFKD